MQDILPERLYSIFETLKCVCQILLKAYPFLHLFGKLDLCFVFPSFLKRTQTNKTGQKALNRRQFPGLARVCWVAWNFERN